MKRNQFQFIGMLAVMTILLSSCWFLGPSVKGDGNVKEETRQVDPFDKIEVSRGMNVTVIQDSLQEVVVVADNNLHEVIETEVENGVLKVFVNENVRWAKEKKVKVTVAKLYGVKVSSGANANSANQFVTNDIEFRATSGGNLTFEVNAEDLEADCSSGANIFLSGLAERAELEASSGANLKGKELAVQTCRMRSSSGGNVYATVAVRLDAKATSGGNITYYGEPKTTNIENSSGGNIRHRD